MWGENGRTRRSFMRDAGAGAAGLSVMGYLAACGGDDEGQSAAETTGQENAENIKRGGTFTVGLIGAGKAETIAPGQANQVPDVLRIYNLYDRLFMTGADGNVNETLAQSAEPSADGKTWTIRLRDGVVFHDGKPLTADDLLYTVNTWSDKEHAGNGQLGGYIDFKGVRKRDRMTVEIPLNSPIAELPSFLTNYFFAVVQDGSLETSGEGQYVGTGPFVFGSFSPGSRSVFTANKDYWQEGKPYIDEFVVDSSFSDDSARFNALLGGQIDAMMELPYTQAKAQQSGGDIVVLDAEGGRAQFFTMHCRKAPFDDVRVRQAFKLFVDRQAMVDQALSGFGTVGNDNYPVSSPYYADDVKPEFDVEKAKSLLKAAGQEGLTVTLPTSEIFPGTVESATLMKQQAAKAGVKVNVRQVSATDYYGPASGYLTRPFAQEFIGSVSSMSLAWSTLISGTAPYNGTQWAQPGNKIDKMINDAIGEVDEAKAKEKWHELQVLNHETGGELVWSNINYVDGLTKRVKGLKPSKGEPLGGRFFTDVWLES